MTKAVLRKICEDKKLYRTAYLNDKLYLHYKVRAERASTCHMHPQSWRY